jgi:hypothetical protein
MREVLAREIDHTEKLRWSGQPDAQHAFRWAVPGAIVGFVLFGGGAVATGFACRHLWREATGLVPVAMGSKPSIGGVYALAAFGAFFLLIAVLCALMPWFARAKARRTIYGLTDTRVMKVVVGRSGNVATEAVEPAHPLAIARQDHGPLLGDVFVYPRQASGRTFGQIALMGVENPREVERLIRHTFDPPEMS